MLDANAVENGNHIHITLQKFTLLYNEFVVFHVTAIDRDTVTPGGQFFRETSCGKSGSRIYTPR